MGKQATKFGVYGKAPPADFLGQMAYPFRRAKAVA